MGHQHRLQARRFELKYLVDEAKARAIRAFLLNRLEPDSFTKPGTFGYSVRSLYLDSPALVLKQQTDEGHKNRFKLRMRFYDDNEASPIFLEIKRRENDVIRKERAAVSRAGAERLLSGRRPDVSHLIHADAKSESALFNFCALCDHIGAIGSVFVIYLREAYVSPTSDELRITFDRELESRPYTQGEGLKLPAHSTRPPIQGAILEIKFTDRFPYWTRELVYAFDLERQSMPKYCECVESERRSGMLSPMFGGRLAR
jgi:hypothetical protein